MTNVLKIQRMVKASKADVSALLLIAFIFQLLTPVVVLAADSSIDNDFQSALRHSICRVEISPDSPDTQAHTDGFVCDWCVLVNLALNTNLERHHSDVFTFSQIAKSSLAYGRVDVASLGPTMRKYFSAQRAPPHFQEKQIADGDGFLKVPPRKNRRLAI